MREDVGLTLLREMLDQVMTADKHSAGIYLTVVLSFVRHHAEDFAAVLPRRQQLLLRKYSIELPHNQVCCVCERETVCVHNMSVRARSVCVCVYV